VYSIVHTVEAMTFNRRPKLFLKGWNAKVQDDWIPTMEDVLNAEWYDEPSIGREVRICIRDCVKYGWGIAMTTYDAEFPEDYEPEEGDLGVVDQPLMEAAIADAEADIAVEMAERTPFPDEVPTFEHDDRVSFDNINTRRVDPRLFMIDPDASCPEDAKWMGRKIIADLHSVKEFFRDHPRVSELGPTSRPEDEFPGRTGRNRQDVHQSPYQNITLYEVWEKIVGGGWRRILMPKDHDFVLSTTENPFHGGCPFHILRWNEDGVTIWSQSDIEPIWSIMLAERITSTKVVDGYTREHEDTYLFDQSVGITEEQMNVVNDPGVAKYIPVTSGGRRLSDLIYKLPKDTKSPEVLQLLSLYERQFQIGTGLGPNQFSQAMKSGTSATESAEVAGFARARGSHKYGAVEEFVSAIASFRLGLMIQFYDAERIARMAGAEGAAVWTEIKEQLNHPGEIKKGMRVRVQQGSMKPENDEQRLQSLMALLQVSLSNPALSSNVNMPAIFEDISRALGNHRGSRYLITEDAQKMAMAMAAMQLMQQGAGPNGQGSPAAAGPIPQTAGQARQNMAGTPGGNTSPLAAGMA